MSQPMMLTDYHQIVVPRSYHPEILNLVHETPMSGHLCVNKTYHKILNHFLWPGLKSDVFQHCKFCHTCQMVGKPNQILPKANLQPIPAFGERFSRIITVCSGPLPKTKSGCQNLTIMCTSTRFPEAIPLRQMKTKTIVKTLVKLFTFVSLLFFLSVCLCAHLFIYSLWSPAGKRLTSWLSFVVYNFEFVTFPLVSWVRCGT